MILTILLILMSTIVWFLVIGWLAPLIQTWKRARLVRWDYAVKQDDLIDMKMDALRNVATDDMGKMSYSELVQLRNMLETSIQVVKLESMLVDTCKGVQNAPPSTIDTPAEHSGGQYL